MRVHLEQRDGQLTFVAKIWQRSLRNTWTRTAKYVQNILSRSCSSMTWRTDFNQLQSQL